MLAEAAAQLGTKHLFVVHGSDGLDEFTTTGASFVAEARDGKVLTFEVHPRDVGIAIARAGDLRGGTPQENAAIIRRVLSGELFPPRDIVLLNAAAALVAGQIAADLKSGIVLAAKSVDSGAAQQKLDQLIAATHSP
jgi:anthranilate phosphoribosyltransferase